MNIHIIGCREALPAPIEILRPGGTDRKAESASNRTTSSPRGTPASWQSTRRSVQASWGNRPPGHAPVDRVTEKLICGAIHTGVRTTFSHTESAGIFLPERRKG